MSLALAPADRLTSLAQQINELHTKIRPTRNMVRWAIECGELLLETQKEVPKGSWLIWLSENVDVHPTTAFGYMRLARYKDVVLRGNHTGIDPALDALSGLSVKRLPEEAKAEMVRLFDEGKGMSLTEIAELFGVSKGTVHYHVTAKARNRVKRIQRQQRDKGRRALDREETRSEIARHGGRISKAYALVRQAQQQLDAEARLAALEPFVRVRVLEALSALYAAEDEIGQAVRLSGRG